MKKEEQKEKHELGITAEKDEISEWFTQLIQKAELIEYTAVSGCYVLRPRCYFIWEKIQEYFDNKIKLDGVKNVSFPLLIPESFLLKEQEHVEGFSPEVAWVTQTGDTKLPEKLAIRPTSESMMYSSYAKWIRSYRDLPLRLNQWNNVVRWEFKNPVPLIRSREFLWQEGHTCFATKEEADKEAEKIQQFYADTYKEMYAIPVIKGIKTEKEKFAGAQRTLTTEAFLPSGKCAQAATSHNLGQNFAKAFNIQFKDKDEKDKFPFQNSWGLSTRSIGIAIMMHSDNKGLVLSPRISDIQVMIVPIFKTPEEKKQIIREAEKIQEMLKKQNIRIEIDSRDASPGFKFNDLELKGIPLRLELGPKDLKEKQVFSCRRDSEKKEAIKITELEKKIPKILDDIHSSLYKKAEDYLKLSIMQVKTMQELIEAIKNKKLAKAEWCSGKDCEDWIKTKTEGAKIVCISQDKKDAAKGKCIYCGKKSNSVVYIAKSY
jgi:prolyl-tRNA synthetase